MKDKTNTLLVVGICILFLILAGELYYLFFYQKQEIMTKSNIAQSGKNKSTESLKGLWVKQTEKATESQFTEINRRVDLLKPLFQSGVLKELITTEVYKSVVEEVSNKQESEKNPSGETIDYSYFLSFSTFADNGRKTLRYALSKDELPRVSAFKSQGDEEIPIDLKEIQKGDLVSISITYDQLLSPQDNLISLKIVKLL